MQSLRELLDLLLRTGKLIAGAPMRSRTWTARQWLWRAAFLAIVVLAFWQKRLLQSAIQGRGFPGAQPIAGFINDHANGSGMLAFGFAVYLAALVFRRQVLRETAAVFLVAGAWDFLLWSAGHFTFAERRPVEGGAMRFFAGDGHGFSGHAAVAALLVLPVREVLARARAPRTRHLITALLLAWVLLVGWSRVFLGMHFVWNIFSGAAVGLWTSSAAVEAWREQKEADTSNPSVG